MIKELKDENTKPTTEIFCLEKPLFVCIVYFCEYSLILLCIV
jgi:hypothetical protein